MRLVQKITASILLAVSLMLASTTLFASEGQYPQRIVALSPHSVELLFSLDAGDRIIATTEFADYPAAALQIPRVGGFHGISIERIIELQPDLVIAWKGGNNEQDIERLKKMGLNVYESYPQALEQIGEELIKLGQMIGKAEKGREASEQFYRRLHKLRSNYSKRDPVQFFYQVWAQPLRAMAAGSWINEVITGCGGVNVLDDSYPDYPEVSLESILLMQPQVILQPTQHGADLSTGVNWLNWPEVPAVQDGHIYSINGDILHRFTLRILDGMAEVCRDLDKVRAARANLKETIDQGAAS